MHNHSNKYSSTLYPFSNNAELTSAPPRVIAKGKGVYIWDDKGNKYLDAFAGLWCVNVGYGRKELVEAAANQMEQLSYYNLFFNSTTKPTLKLAETITDIAPDHMNTVFFTNSGSEANDTVYRLVRRYWDLKGKFTKQHFIARHNGYHGSTVFGASLGGMQAMHTQGNFPMTGISHICQPYTFGMAFDCSVEEFGVICAKELETKICEIGPDNVAAFFAEPIQGAGGVIIPPSSYWPEIQRICKKYDVLLVVDEVVCGFGRTGSWFGCDTFNIKADLMPIAKGLSSGYLPIGGVIISDEIADTLKSEDAGEFAHGFTYSGHATCAAVALENIRILKEENVVDSISRVTGPYLSSKLKELEFIPIVGEVRSVGLIGAIELVSPSDLSTRYDNKGTAGQLCRKIALEHGLILRATGDTMLISPPLTITLAEIDEMIEKMEVALALAADQLSNVNA